MLPCRPTHIRLILYLPAAYTQRAPPHACGYPQISFLKKGLL